METVKSERDWPKYTPVLSLDYNILVTSISGIAGGLAAGTRHPCPVIEPVGPTGSVASLSAALVVTQGGRARLLAMNEAEDVSVPRTGRWLASRRADHRQDGLVRLPERSTRCWHREALQQSRLK